MRSESATLVLMLRPPETVVNRAAGQVLQSKISQRMAENVEFIAAASLTTLIAYHMN